MSISFNGGIGGIGKFSAKIVDGASSIPVWVTAAGNLGTLADLSTITSLGITLEATDADGLPSAVTYSVTGGALPTGASLNSSTGEITGPAVEDGTGAAVTFTVTATDGNTPVERTFDIIVDEHITGLITTGVVEQTFVNPNTFGTEAGDAYCKVVDVTASYAIVGSDAEDSATGTTVGTADIWSTSTGAKLHALVNPNANGGTDNTDRFASDVAISENFAIVGARGEDVGAAGSGTAYVYNSSTGALLHTLVNPNHYNTINGDRFGTSCAISASYAAISAPLEDGPSGNSDGVVYMYDTTNFPTVLRTLENPNHYGTPAGDNFGDAGSLAICESYTIVGAVAEDAIGGTSSGVAYVFDNATGNLLWTLVNPNPFGTEQADGFGHSVDISENYAIVGAPLEDGADGSSVGEAYVFDMSTGLLAYTLVSPNGALAADKFGNGVAVSDTYFAVGAPGVDNPTANSGRLYIYKTIDGTILHDIENPSQYLTTNGDAFGNAVAICEEFALAGTPAEDAAGGLSSGVAYLIQ